MFFFWWENWGGMEEKGETMEGNGVIWKFGKKNYWNMEDGENRKK